MRVLRDWKETNRWSRVKPQSDYGKKDGKDGGRNVLFEGAMAYEPGEKSKTEIEDRILQLKERIGDQDKLLEDYGSQEEADG